MQEYLEESIQVAPSNHEVLGDSVAWGGCTIIYLLGQQLHFELFDFSYQVLNVAEAEAAAITRNPHSVQVYNKLFSFVFNIEEYFLPIGRLELFAFNWIVLIILKRDGKRY